MNIVITPLDHGSNAVTVQTRDGKFVSLSQLMNNSITEDLILTGNMVAPIRCRHYRMTSLRHDSVVPTVISKHMCVHFELSFKSDCNMELFALLVDCAIQFCRMLSLLFPHGLEKLENGITFSSQGKVREF